MLWPTPEGMTKEAKYMAATVVLMGCWWIGESLPLGVTALLPLVAYPLLRIMPYNEVAPHYATHFVFFLLGGFFIALSMQKWELHTRIALWIIKVVGTSAKRLVLGFMVATGFMSMWISDSATAMMMMPIGLGLIMKIEQIGKKNGSSMSSNFSTCLMLGIAYSASIGGVGTLVGTFPNLVFAGMFKHHFPDGPDISFVEWIKIGLPFAAVFIPVTWAYLVLIVFPIKGKVVEGADDLIDREIAKLGKMKQGEALILSIFVATALLWIFRKDIHLGAISIPGWSGLLGLEDPVTKKSWIHDSTIAVIMGIMCFILPAETRKGTPLLDWEYAKQLPWGILLLFGGGFAIAAGFNESGLTIWVGSQLKGLQNLPLPLVIAIITMVVTLLTNVTSNTATTTMILPILAATAIVLKLNPLLFMVPATIAASCAFILPIGTPPAAIVFATGRINLLQMVKTGILLTVITVTLVTVYVYFVMVPMLDISTTEPPAWIHSGEATSAQ
ncbi:MAG: SLC13/DASS family transporter [Proteobacteria bacterium]|nr:SLC13/DASS family transporter [Pseudomonadota bacterium]